MYLVKKVYKRRYENVIVPIKSQSFSLIALLDLHTTSSRLTCRHVSLSLTPVYVTTQNKLQSAK